MNKIQIFIVVIMSTTFFVEGCDTSADKAVTFFDKVHAPVEKCIEVEEAYHQQVDVFLDYSADSSAQSIKNIKEELNDLRTHLNELSEACMQAGQVLDSLEIYEGGEDLYRSAVNVVSAYKALCADELPQMVRLLELPPKEEDEEWYKKMDHLLYLLDSKVGERMEIFEQEAYEFAGTHNIELYEE